MYERIVRFGSTPVQFTQFRTHAMPWVCYRRRNQWLRLALASFCLPLMWLARVVYLLVVLLRGGAGGGRHAHPCAVLGLLCYVTLLVLE